VALDGIGYVRVVEGLVENVLEEVAGGDHRNCPCWMLNRFKIQSRIVLNRFKMNPQAPVVKRN
jgi:hypothetical protein